MTMMVKKFIIVSSNSPIPHVPMFFLLSLSSMTTYATLPYPESTGGAEPPRAAPTPRGRETGMYVVDWSDTRAASGRRIGDGDLRGTGMDHGMGVQQERRARVNSTSRLVVRAEAAGVAVEKEKG